MRYLSLAAILAASIGISVSAVADDSSASIKQQILAQKNRIWKDADSIRDAAISSEVHWCLWWSCVCIEANAKNSYGGYTGIERTAIMFNGGTIHEAISGGKFGYAHVCRDIS
jgi:hypothetical protein